MSKVNYCGLVYFLVAILMYSPIIGCSPRVGRNEGEAAIKGAGEPSATQTFAGIEMVWCPSGTFNMGSENGESLESPVHEVTLTSGFWMGKYEVTQAQWFAVMGSNPSDFFGDNQPVEQVSWNNVQDFITTLNAQTDESFRLPTEAEWEYACRAGTTTEYSFGDDSGSLGDYAWYADNSSLRTHDVGGKLANPWGLYDMHGNVWEWCQDRYDSSYYSSSPSADPMGPESGPPYRVLRGGSRANGPEYCRSAGRVNNSPVARNDSDGFRLVRTP